MVQIITAEPEYIKAILATQFDEFEKGAEIRHLFEPLLGTGVFAADGELWKYVHVQFTERDTPLNLSQIPPLYDAAVLQQGPHQPFR